MVGPEVDDLGVHPEVVHTWTADAGLEDTTLCFGIFL
jgi:hypothetical protein